MAYTEHDKWADDLCNSGEVASPHVAEMISDRLNAQAAEIEGLLAVYNAAKASTIIDRDYVAREIVEKAVAEYREAAGRG